MILNSILALIFHFVSAVCLCTFWAFPTFITFHATIFILLERSEFQNRFGRSTQKSLKGLTLKLTAFLNFRWWPICVINPLSKSKFQFCQVHSCHLGYYAAMFESVQNRVWSISFSNFYGLIIKSLSNALHVPGFTACFKQKTLSTSATLRRVIRSQDQGTGTRIL